MFVQMAPQGRLIKGHVLDVNERRFNEALRFYDKQLYTKWNPRKLRGHGCWEIRRRPEFNSAIDITELNGEIIFNTGPKEYDLVHQVMDCAFLNYDQIRKLKEIDTWQYGNAQEYQAEIDRKTKSREDKEFAAILKEKKDMIRHYRTDIRRFMEMVRDGVNPHLIAQYWDSVKAAD